MTDTLTTERIAELRSTVPHLDIDQIGVKGGDDPTVEVILAHFRSVAHQFADPGEDGKCLNCGRIQGGLLGAFSWGIIHGEGSCVCGWPARVFHFVEMPDGHRRRVDGLLQYHPDGIDLLGDTDA